MTSTAPCGYCDWKVAKVRRPGDVPTCVGCADLPQRERDHDAEVDRLVARHYEGDAPTPRSNPKADVES